jgi:transposase
MPDYPSNLTKEQFEFIRPDLESFRKRTHPRTVALYDVFNAVIYVLRTGSQWRQLPNDFPKWQTVYDYFRMWSRPLPHSEDSLLDLLLKKLSHEIAYNWGDQYELRSSSSTRKALKTLNQQNTKATMAERK